MTTCKDCLHNHVCALWRAQEGQDAKSWSDSDDWDCDYFDDKSRFVEMPCKVGDKLYRIFTMDSDAIKPWVGELPEIVERIGVATKNIMGHWNVYPIDYFGKRVFLTREEAEADLAERTGE